MELPKVNFASEDAIRNLAKNVSMWDRVKSLSKSVGNWIAEDAPITKTEVFNDRIEICKKCEYWAGNAFAKTGKCKICGCSTQLKLRMATEKCPVGKW